MVEKYPLEMVKNLMVVGGHTINSTTIAHLIRNGAFISFFDPDGRPVGTIRPFGDQSAEENREYQKAISRQRYAIAIGQGSIKSRLFAIQRVQEKHNVSLFYQGELEFLHKAEDELAYLIKMGEIRRLIRLTSDMYYEIMARNLLPDFGFRRRTMRPHSDPINAMLSFGYAMLFGNCLVSLIGARLDPDIGLMHEGSGSLVYDLIEPLKAEMIDNIVFQISRESLKPADFDQNSNRCMLSDELLKKMIGEFYTTINNKKINEQVINFNDSMKNHREFKVLF